LTQCQTHALHFLAIKIFSSISTVQKSLNLPCGLTTITPLTKSRTLSEAQTSVSFPTDNGASEGTDADSSQKNKPEVQLLSISGNSFALTTWPPKIFGIKYF